MKAKLKAIWLILRSKGYWVVIKKKDNSLIRQYRNISIGDTQVVIADINEQVSTEIDCIDAVNEAARIANGCE